MITIGSKLEKYRSRLPVGESAFNAVLNDYRQQAKRRGLEWSLTADEAKNLFQAPCVFCGRPPVQVKKIRQGRGSFAFNGIDRTTNYVGYVPSNCVTCCWVCNWMKRDLTTGEFLEHVRLICQHMNLDAEGADTQNSDTQFPFGALREPLTTGEGSGILIQNTKRRMKMSKGEGWNPSVSCGFSRTHEPEHEEHAPTPVTDPFTKGREKTLDTANQGLLE